MNPNNNPDSREEDAEEEYRAIEIELVSSSNPSPMRSRGCFKLLRYATFLMEISASVIAVLLGLWLSITIAYNFNLSESEQLKYKQQLNPYRNDTDFNVTCEPYISSPSNRNNDTEICHESIPVSNGIFLALGIIIIALSVARIITMMIYYKNTPAPDEEMKMKTPFLNWCFVGVACIVCETRGTLYLYQMSYSKNPPIYPYFEFTNDPYNNFYYGCNYLIFYFAQNFYYVVLSKVVMLFAHGYCKYSDCEEDEYA